MTLLSVSIKVGNPKLMQKRCCSSKKWNPQYLFHSESGCNLGSLLCKQTY